MSIKTMEGYCKICRENVTVEKKKPKQRNVFSNIVFSIVTGGLYLLIWTLLSITEKKDMALHSM